MKKDKLIEPGKWFMAFDSSGSITEAGYDASYYRILGYEPDELEIKKFKDWTDRIHPEDVERVIAYSADVCSKHLEGMDHDVEYRMMTRWGWHWFHDYGHCLRSEDGSLMRCDGVIFDIQDTVDMESMQKDLAENNARLFALEDDFESLYDVELESGNYVSYVKGDFYQSNVIDKLVEPSDYFEDLRANIDSIIYAEDRDGLYSILTRDAIRRELAESEHFDYYYRIITENGPLWFKIRIVYKNAEKKNVIIGVFNAAKDVEAKQLVEQKAQLEQARKAADAANRAKTEFLFNMSHDIRTPMTAILGFTNMAKKHLDDRARVEDCLEKTLQSGNLLLALINSVLDMSRIESGSAELHEDFGDIYYSFSNIESALHEIAAAKDINLTFEFGPVTDRYVYADFQRCVRVFTNLIANAIKYNYEGGYVKVRCEQASPQENGTALYRYTVEDNGFGMSEEFQEHMFEAFAREHNSTHSGIQGTGLGLSVCRSFVEYMGGTIECSSRPDEGTVFTVMLPFRIQEGSRYTDPVTGEVVTLEAEKETFKPADFSGKRALLVEDNELNREIALDILEDAGFIIEEAEDGSVAVEMLREKGPEYYDCVLMDIQMPVMDGYEATREIRAMYPQAKLPIIVVSANAFEEDRLASKLAGMDDHVAKPINLKELFAALAKFL